MKTWRLFLLCLLFISCSSLPQEEIIVFSQIPYRSIHSSEQALMRLDTLRIPIDLDNALTTLSGRFFTMQNDLCFGDDKIALIHIYDTLGHFKYTLNTPKQIHNISMITYRDGILSVLGPSWDFALMQGDSIMAFTLDFSHSERSFLNRFLFPKAYLYDTYEIDYHTPSLSLYNKRHLIFPITSEHPLFNGYQGLGVRNFFRNAHTIGMFDVVTDSLFLLAQYPPIYTRKGTPNFMNISFDYAGDTLFFNYNMDSLIYKMNLKSHRIFESMGCGLPEMNQNYPCYRNLEKSESFYNQDRINYGYYNHIYYDSHNELLFRTCYVGDQHKEDILQIYHHNALVGSYRVPHNFYVFGHINNKYYGAGDNDIVKEQFLLYPFSLKLVSVEQ